jgi:hypothetical protein
MHRGLLWWRSQLSRFIYRPNANVRAHIDALLLRLPWPSPPSARNHPLPPHHEGEGGGKGGASKGAEQAGGGGGGGGGGVVGIHVRRGDKLLGIDGFQGVSLRLVVSFRVVFVELNELLGIDGFQGVSLRLVVSFRVVFVELNELLGIDGFQGVSLLCFKSLSIVYPTVYQKH